MKTVLITGASSGIGKATAELFAKTKFGRLILCGRRRELLDSLAGKLGDTYQIPIQTLAFDIRDRLEVEGVLNTLTEPFSEIDVLVNNAGLAKGLDYFHEAKYEDWETMIDTNIKGILYISRIISSAMVKRGRGHIINVCSTAGKEVYPKGSVYCASKFAVDALTKGMRQDLYTHNIRVSQVAPGHTEQTEFALTRFDGDASKAKIYGDFNPLKAEDVASSIYFIASQPDHVNIQDILLMGTQQASSTLIARTGRFFDK